MASLLLVGLFLITNSHDGYNLSNSSLHEFNIWFFIVVLAFYYKDKPWPKKADFIAFWLAILTVIIVMWLSSYFSS